MYAGGNNKNAQRRTDAKTAASIFGLIQGLVFWIAYYWSKDPSKTAFLSSFVIFVSIMGLILQLSWTGEKKGRLYSTSFIVSLVFSLIALWVWFQLPDAKDTFRGDNSRVGTFIAATMISVYILLPYIQVFQERSKFEFPYAELFRHGWNNFFIISIALFFMGLFRALIFLWGSLFDVLGISFFSKIFYSAPFNFIILPVAFGFGITIGKQNGNIIITLRNIVLTAFKALLPLLALISLLFLAMLPYTGLKPLWDTKYASTITLSLLIFNIVFINAVFQDGTAKPPYHVWIRRFVEAMLLAMPLYSAITLYSVWLRIAQYGLTPERIFAFIFAVIAGLYGCGYAISVIWKKDVWIGFIEKVNLVMSLVIVLVALLIHTPVLDTLSLSARNQYNRLVQGKADAKAFDYSALRFKLGRAGYEKLKALGELKNIKDASIINARVKDVLNQNYYTVDKESNCKELKEEHLKILTPSGKLPEGLFASIKTQSWAFEADKCAKNGDCVVFAMNMDDDAEDEYLLTSHVGCSSSILLFDNIGKWEYIGKFKYKINCEREQDMKALIDDIKKSNIKAVQPKFRDLMISNEALSLEFWKN